MILVIIVVYLVVGISANLYYIAITAETPLQQYSSSHNEMALPISINNNAQLTLPLINAVYTINVHVSGDNNTYAWFSNAGHGNTLPLTSNFTNYNLDIGTLDSGEGDFYLIFVHTDGSNFSVTLNAILNFPFSLKATSATYLFETIIYEGYNYYSVTRAR